MPFLDVHSVPYEQSLINSIRTTSLAQMFPRQMPKIAHNVNTHFLGENACPGGGRVSMTTSYFSPANYGPYQRIIDPTVNLLDVYNAHSQLPWRSKLWNAIKDKAPPGNKFVLRGSGSIQIPIDTIDTDREGAVTFVNRSHCLKIDPIRIQIEFKSTSLIDFRMLLRGCRGLDLVHDCTDMYLEKGEVYRVPAIRTTMIGIDVRRDLGPMTCSETNQEDVLIKLTNIEPFVTGTRTNEERQD